MSVGSTNHVPVVPPAAEVFTDNPVKSTVRPDVSTNPPLPVTPVARADKIPLAVTLSPSAIMLPASLLALSTLIVPPSLTLPLLPDTLRASILAGKLTISRTALRASVTLAAAIRPSVDIAALAGSATCKKPPPCRSSVVCVAAPITTLPAGAAI